MRDIQYTVEDAGKINEMQHKLRQWNRHQHRQLIEDAEDDLVEVPDEIEVLFDDSKPEWTIDEIEVLFDDSKPEWTIDKLYEVIGNAKKKKKK